LIDLRQRLFTREGLQEHARICHQTQKSQ
jgi:hypothetical protein